MWQPLVLVHYICVGVVVDIAISC